MYVINSSYLKPVNDDCFIDKYADDSYLIVPAGSDAHIMSELYNIENWAIENNLKLNKTKSVEMVVYRNENSKKSNPMPNLLPEITRVESIKILGVQIDNHLSVHEHVEMVCQTAAQALYGIKILKSHGLDQHSIYCVCHAVVLSRLLYAAPAWWGFASATDRTKLQAVLNRAMKWGFYKGTDPSVEQACAKRERHLFTNVLADPSHVLHQFLPPAKPQQYDLRARAHNRLLPVKNNLLICKNFLTRMLYQTLMHPDPV